MLIVPNSDSMTSNKIIAVPCHAIATTESPDGRRIALLRALFAAGRLAWAARPRVNCHPHSDDVVPRLSPRPTGDETAGQEAPI
jgi:hypothetical protein